MKELIKLQFEGKENCEHDFVYCSASKMTFTKPPTYIKKRICKCCGRAEIILDDELGTNNNAEYGLLYENFHGKANTD